MHVNQSVHLLSMGTGSHEICLKYNPDTFLQYLWLSRNNISDIHGMAFSGLNTLD